MLFVTVGLFKAATDKEDVDEEQHEEEYLPSDSEKEEGDGEATEEGGEEEGVAEEESQEPEIQYDEETQALIDEANIARERFQEAEKSVKDLHSEIGQLEEKVDRDYGLEEEFASLDGECYEYADLEYIYQLCPYNKASQRSKSGGSDVTLGRWSGWVESKEHSASGKYSKMKYDQGQSCWNGPMRSTIVTLSCGLENMLISVTEPNRCEYAMEFSTPALCNLNKITTTDTHDEL